MSVPFVANVSFIFSGDAKKLRDDYLILQTATAKTIEFMGKMMMMLHKRGSLTDEELSSLIQYYTQMARPNLNAALEIARRNNNPLLPDEANRLQLYINKANQTLPFSQPELDDYSQLVQKAKEELSKTR